MQVTGWQDWYAEVDRELRALRERCAHVFVFGLSMGGALTLRLAAKHGDGVSGIVVVNPANKVHGLAAYALPLLRHFVRTVPGITSDIAKDGGIEIGYDKVPLHAAHSMRNFYRLLDGELPQVTQPMLLLHSPQDHVVPPADSARVLSRVSSVDVTEILLEQSYHVATLDHDADRIFEESFAFVSRLAPGRRQGEPARVRRVSRKGRPLVAEHDADREPDEKDAPPGGEQGPSFDETAAWEAIVAGYGDEPPDPPGAKPFKSVEDLALLEPETNDAAWPGRLRRQLGDAQGRQGQAERYGRYGFGG